VRVDVCVTAADDLSGVAQAVVGTRDPAEPFFTGFFSIGFAFPPGTTTPTEMCISAVVPVGSPQQENLIVIQLADRVGNAQLIKHPLIPCGGPPTAPLCQKAQDLCALGFPCSIENKPLGSSPDTDGDGVPDIADNCPNDPNPNQEDRDLDLIGDVCDPFPNDSDNEQAQCEADLAQCQAGVTPDQDGDGEANATDACPDTPSGAAVDQAGCSLAQFCAAIDATTAQGAKVCKNSDWRNDEPLAASNKGDCKVKMGNPGRADDLCVPRL
jgi:hypothetical protein